MRRSEKETTSPWHVQTEKLLLSTPLHADMQCDVCIVGGGIAGLTSGYLLQKEGKNVVICDAWTLGSGETGRTTAHLASVLDDRFSTLEKVFGEDATHLAADSHRAAIDLIESIVREHNIGCDFERLNGYLVALPGQEEDLEKEMEASRRAGFSPILSDAVSLPGIALGKNLRFSNQATFHISKYMAGLARAFMDRGGQIFTGTHINTVSEDHGRPSVETDNGYRISADAVIVATNTPVNDWVKMHTKQAAYRSYVTAFTLPKDAHPSFLLWDMGDPYHYVRILRGQREDLLIVGGEDHKTGQANDALERYNRLEAWTRAHFPFAGARAYQWSGQIMEPVDHLAFIGKNPGNDNVYVITGDSGQGMTHATLGAKLVTDLVMGRENPWAHLYDPARKTLRTAPTYVKENSNVVGCLVSDWVAPSEAKHVDEIPVGQGAIMREGISKVAVYKDEAGEVHKCSAVCPHLGCIVQWNAGEKSWDCPCHGSRFDTEGKILNGPALKPLEDHHHEHPVMQGAERLSALGTSATK